MDVSQSENLLDQIWYEPPSWQDALRSRESGTEHRRSSTRLGYNRVTRGRSGDSSLESRSA
jgi:hypothetical protein